MSKAIKKIAPIALPIIGSAIPGLGTALGAALGGAAGGLVSGGGLKGALLGAGTSALSSGLGSVLGTAGTPINWTSAAPGYSTGLQTVGGSGLLGGLSRALGGTNIGQSVSQGINSILPNSGASSIPGVGGGVSGSTLGGSLGNLASNVFSGIQGTEAYKDMQKQQLNANRQALGAISPFAASGTAANQQLANLLGLNPDVQQDDILAQLRATPGYDFQLQQGQQAMDRAQAARGGFFSGEALKASQQYGQGLADQMYNDAVARLQQQSGQGLSAAGAQADLFGQAGDIRANTTLGRSNLLSQTLANILNPV